MLDKRAVRSPEDVWKLRRKHVSEVFGKWNIYTWQRFYVWLTYVALAIRTTDAHPQRALWVCNPELPFKDNNVSVIKYANVKHCPLRCKINEWPNKNFRLSFFLFIFLIYSGVCDFVLHWLLHLISLYFILFYFLSSSNTQRRECDTLNQSKRPKLCVVNI